MAVRDRTDIMGSNILIINPGSTSDRVAYYRGENEVLNRVVRYSPADLEPFDGKPATSQSEMRTNFVLETLKQEDVEFEEIDAAIGRGGLLKPIEGGTRKTSPSSPSSTTS